MCGDKVAELGCTYTVASLPIASAKNDRLRINIHKWPHFYGVTIPSLADRTVGILISCGIPEAQVVSKQRLGVGKQPYAVIWRPFMSCEVHVTAVY